ncbi:hypothetical protein Tco_1089792 [Tanacetum coccineum]
MALRNSIRFQRCKEREKRKSLRNKLLTIYSPFRLQRRRVQQNNSSFRGALICPLSPLHMLKEGQAGPNPGIDVESQLQLRHVVHAGPNLKHMDLGTSDASTQQKAEQMDEDSLGTLSSLQNFKKDLSFTDQFFVEKPQEEEPGKTNADADVQSMVSVPIYQDTSSVPPMTTPVIDLKTMQSDSPLLTSTATTSIIKTTTSLPPPPQPQQSTTNPILVSRIAPLRVRFRDLPTVDMKEILQQRVFEDDSYKAHTIYNDLYEALQKLLELDYSNQRLADQEEAHKKRRKRRNVPKTPPGSPPSQPLPPPPSAGVSGTLGTSGALGYESSGIFVTHELSPNDSLMQDDSIPEEQVHLSDDEDSKTDYQSKADSRKDCWKPLPKEERPATPEPTWTIPSSNKCRSPSVPDGGVSQDAHKSDLEYLRYGSKGRCPALSISKMKAANYPNFGLELLVPEKMWIDDMCTYNISAKYGISHWWFTRQKFYIDRHDSLADHQEYMIAEKDFKNLYPSDFEDLNLLLFQGHLDHLYGSDKRMLSTAVKLWTRNLVIRQRVEDFQLGIESYQTQLNLTKPGWDVTGYEFKYNYTIIKSPRAVVFPVNNNEGKIMRFNEIYKFSDGTLRRILEALAYRVKEFKIKRLNPGMNTRFWTEKDVTRSNEFIAAIERRLKTKRIYRNLECFVGGRVRDIDYRLLQRIE